MMMRWAVHRRLIGRSTSWRSWPEYDGLEANGEKGAILRREGLHTFHLAEWRRAVEAGRRTARAPGTAAGSGSTATAAEASALAGANRKVARLEAELAKNRLASEIMEKSTRALGDAC